MNMKCTAALAAVARRGSTRWELTDYLASTVLAAWQPCSIDKCVTTGNFTYFSMSSFTRADNDESTVLGNGASDFRARLRSEAPQYTVPQHDEFLRRLKSRLQGDNQTQLAGMSASKFLALTVDCIARIGADVFISARQKVSAAHDATAAEIATFSNHATAMLDCLSSLYDDISYPLSVTLCRSRSFPPGSLASHLTAMQEHILSTENELKRLNDEWHACRQEQRTILASINSVPALIDINPFIKEVDDILRKSQQEMDAVEKVRYFPLPAPLTTGFPCENESRDGQDDASHDGRVNVALFYAPNANVI